MFGVLYPIDEDAYRLLEDYVNNMRSYFSNQTGGSEIADDIESRVAELMAELSGPESGIITIEHVQEIIGRIGNPEEIDTVGANVPSKAEAEIPGQEESATSEDVRPRKKLFRDMDHKMLGGVIAGLGCYLGVNPLWLRIATVLLAWPSFGIAILAYIICWCVIPPATTPAERLEMKGEPVNLTSLRDEFLKSEKIRPTLKSGERFLNGILRFICSVFKVVLIGLGIAVLTGCAVVLVIAFIGLCFLLFAPSGEYSEVCGNFCGIIPLGSIIPMWLVWFNCLSLIAMLSAMLYLGVQLILKSVSKPHHLNRRTVMVSLAVLLLAAVGYTGSWIRIYPYIRQHDSEMREHFREIDRQNASESAEKNRSLLTEDGWRIVEARNLDNQYLGNGEHYSGNRHRTYIEGISRDGSMVYEVVRNMKVAPGKYTLEAIARTDGTGCEIFAVNGSGKRSSAAVPVCGRHGGNIWADACASLKADTAVIADKERLKKIAGTHDKKGYGWSTVRVTGIEVGPDSTLTYGVTNQSPNTLWDGTRFSATTFSLTRE